MTRASVVWFACVLALATAVPAGAQQQVRPVGSDSVSIQFVNVELRVVAQALGRYLDRPLLLTSVPTATVTLETQSPIARTEVRALLEGLLVTHRVRLVRDSTAGIYRIEALAPPVGDGSARSESAGPPTRGRPNGQAAAPGELQLFTLRLRHARAAEVAGTVNALYGRASAVGEIGARPATLDAALRDARVGTAAPPAPPNAVASVAGLTATLAGDVTIVPDAATNSLLIRATERDFALIRAAVEELDIRPLQVLISVLIAEVRRDRGFSLGVAAEVPATAVGGGNTTVSGSNAGIGLGDLVLTALNVGGLDISGTLRAAAARGDVRITSRPVVLAANNERAEILVGSQRPFVQVSRSLPTDAPQRDQVVQYRDVGTRLSVLPTISADGYVMLEVVQEVNAVTSETAFDAPVISTRTVSTRLLVGDGQTAILGGLSDLQRDRNQGGVPLLSAIPIVGALFGRASRRTTDTELFVFLTPTVLYNDGDVDAASKAHQSQSRRGKQ